MENLTDHQVRASFVNATKGEVARMNLPPDLGARPWTDRDVLAWVDPQSPLSGHLVASTPERGLVGVRLTRAGAGQTRRARMCSLCTTTHGGQGVALMVAPRAGSAGRAGNTVGLEMCSDLACSAYARGTLKPSGLNAAHETLSVEERVARLHRNVLAFLERVLAS